MQMKQVSVSVVMPCFNASSSVLRSIRSVRAQSLLPCELIVVDDASTDTTPDVLAVLSRDFDPGWFRVIRLTANSGPGHARNVGWAAARGEYIAFLDADDSWLPFKLETQWCYMSTHPDVHLTGHRHAFSTNSALRPDRRPLIAELLQGRSIGRRQVLLKNPFVTPSIMVRREVLSRFAQGRRFMEDQHFLQQCVFSGLRVELLEFTAVELHKPSFGASGLSASLWAMEKGELANYQELHRAGWLRYSVGLLYTYSLLKFLRRLAIVRIRRWRGSNTQLEV